jgi:hypothetical protein
VIRRYEHSDRTREATMNSIKKFFDAANQTAAAVNRQIMDITQRNFNLGLDLAKSLAGAKDPSEIVKLQVSFWWKQFNEFTIQAEEIRKRLFGSTAERKAPEPTPEPGLHEPVSKSLTRPHPAAQDPATARPNQKLDRKIVEMPSLAAKTAESEVGRPKPSIQRSAVENRSTRARSTSGDPARKRGERKPQAKRTPADQVTPVETPQPVSGSKRKRAPHEPAPRKPAPQQLPADVKFGMLDGNAVRFTNFEAWWLVDGAWRSISPDEANSNAAVMREARFQQLFPQVPILPRKAFQSNHR